VKARLEARSLAFDVLRRVEQEGAFASILLQNLPRETPAAEVRLATELVYGTLRHRLTDEYLLAVLAERPLAKIEPDVALLFRMAAHQILRLDRIPEHAAVDEAVKAARGLGGKRRASRAPAAAGFLNAILRRLAREKAALPLPLVPDPESDPEGHAEALSVLHSHPAWIVRRWMARYGPSAAAELLATNNRRPTMWVRVDEARAAIPEAAASLASEGIETEPADFPPGFLRVVEGSPQWSKAFERGWIYVMDRASGIIPHLLAPAEGSRVLDLCSAPGGKALALARMTGPSGMVVAADLHPQRAHLVAANAKRHGVGWIRVVACDASRAPFRGLFDAILVDAPCTGTGVFRRDPESRFRLEPEDLPRLAAIQRAILDAAAALVRPGGRIVYAVCSLEPEEGEEVVARFLEERADFQREKLEERLGGHGDLIGRDGALRILPHRHDMDGFYAAALKRRS